MDVFNKFRPNDINLNIGISDQKGSILYFMFEEAAYNTTNEDRANYILEKGYTKLKERIEIQVDTLENVLDKYASDKMIDVMNIDVETREMSVLRSNNWEKYRPRFIIMESLVNVSENLENIYQDEAIKFLKDKNYIIVAKVANAVFLRDLNR